MILIMFIGMITYMIIGTIIDMIIFHIIITDYNNEYNIDY